MLVLTRKVQEQIVINGTIVVTVVSCKGGRVRLGIDAPNEVTIHRAEVLEQIPRCDELVEHPHTLTLVASSVPEV